MLQISLILFLNVYGGSLWKNTGFGKISFEKWKNESGYDGNSLIADPMFTDSESNNFSFKENSPAYTGMKTEVFIIVARLIRTASEFRITGIIKETYYGSRIQKAA